MNKISFPTAMQIAYLSGRGLKQREIAFKTETSKSTVNRYLTIMKSEEKISYKKDFQTQIKYHFVLYQVFRNPFLTNLQIANKSTDFEFSFSESTCSRIIGNLNIKNRLQQPKEKLTEKHKENRVKFCNNILKSELILLPWVFSDESMVELNPIKKKIKVIPMIDNSQAFFSKSGYPPKIMIWGCVALNFKSPLIWIKNKLNSEKYCELLNRYKIFELLNNRFGSNSYVFQQDGASSHRSAYTLKFLSGKVTLLKGDFSWPANSPDLNVIEIIWAIIKSRINTEYIKNNDQLFREVERIWNEIPIETINMLINSFYTRLNVCIKFKGETLNGKKKFMKKFNESYSKGNELIEKKDIEEKSIEKFVLQSNTFFMNLGQLDMAEKQLNRINCAESSKICRVLPEKLLNKINMPKPILIPSGKVYTRK